MSLRSLVCLKLHTSLIRANDFTIDDTVYRVGSISKLLFLYTFLVEAGHDYWHRPITAFVPELVEAAEACSAEADPLTCPDWDEITLGALASHLAGLGRGRPVTPAPQAIGGIPVTSLGLPPKPVIELAQCEKQPCTRAESIRAFLQEAPVEQAFSTPIYSNGAYQILTYALEAITNRTMSDMITDDVFCPLNMNDSSYSLKANASGIIPNSNNSFWNVPLGDAGATGGVYSSPRDMIKLGQSILKNTQLSPASTRRWLKPWAHTAVWQQAVGLAWEIARWPVDDRIVDIYTKQGDLGTFECLSFHLVEHSMLTFSKDFTTPASPSSPTTTSASQSSQPAAATLPHNQRSSKQSSPTSSRASTPPPNLKPKQTSPAPTSPPTPKSTPPSPSQPNLHSQASNSAPSPPTPPTSCTPSSPASENLPTQTSVSIPPSSFARTPTARRLGSTMQ